MPRTYRHVLSRRTVLRGAGGVIVALPFLDAMHTRSVWGQPPAPPVRAVNLFFGLGVPRTYSTQGVVGPLAPLAKVANKISWFSGVNTLNGRGGFDNHTGAAGAVFVGKPAKSGTLAGGPSIDHVIMNHAYPSGPPGRIKVLGVGSWGSDAPDRLIRKIHSYREDGSPATLPYEGAQVIFERLFGAGGEPSTSPTPVATDPAAAKALRYQRSILDAVLGDYQALSGSSSKLGATSRRRLADHLGEVRELERSIFGNTSGGVPAPTPGATCKTPGAPGPDVPLVKGKRAVDNSPLDLTVEGFNTHFGQMSDLFLLALRCDITRFGYIMCQAGGDDLNYRGDYIYEGTKRATFDGTRAHLHYHNWKKGGNAKTMMEHHIHYVFSNVARFIEKMDDPNHLDANGQTFLKNTFFMVGTEVGDGASHDTDGVFHAIGPCNNKFKAGQHFTMRASDVDLYTTCLKALGIDKGMGDTRTFSGTLDEILA